MDELGVELRAVGHHLVADEIDLLAVGTYAFSQHRHRTVLHIVGVLAHRRLAACAVHQFLVLAFRHHAHSDTVAKDEVVSEADEDIRFVANPLAAR